VVPINIPPLRERKQDIPFLAAHFVKKLAPDSGGRVESITDAAVEKLLSYHWPGNVRELENVIERSLVMCAGTQLDAADIKLESAPGGVPSGPRHPAVGKARRTSCPRACRSTSTSRRLSAKRCAAPTATRARPRGCSASRATRSATG